MKNIIICSDGTWQSPESDTSTHVLRLAEGIAPEDALYLFGFSRIINHALGDIPASGWSGKPRPAAWGWNPTSCCA